MFKQLNDQIQKQFAILASQQQLFRVNISGEKLWEIYMNNFLEHPVWRVNSVHQCIADESFFKTYANIVAIINGKIVSMFDFEAIGEYNQSIKAVSEAIQNSEVNSVFVIFYDDLTQLGNALERSKLNRNQSEYRLGNEKTLKQYLTQQEALGKEIGKVYTYDHFNVMLPKRFVNFTTQSSASILGDLNTTRQLFEKGLNIPLETLEVIRDLIIEDKIVMSDGDLPKIKELIKIKKQFDNLETNKKLWLWSNIPHISIARYTQTLIGELCIEIAEGKDLVKAVEDYNYRNDRSNKYKSIKIVTERQKEEAEKTIVELGYENSFERRFATIDDIDVSEIKHSNIDNTVEKPVGLFGKAGVPTTTQYNRHKRAEFDKVERITIDKFMSEILPNASSVEVFLENRLEGNLVSLFTAKDKTVKNPFKWRTPFSWTYNGNLSGKSMIKENVKTAGGKIDGILRCSLQWNDKDTVGRADYDLHCKTPFDTVYYNNKKDRKSGIWLDVDMIRPEEIGIENITSQTKLPDGKYKFSVHTFCKGSNTGFKVEIEFDGNVFTYHYNQTTPYDSKIDVATITVMNGQMTIEHHLSESSSSRIIWGLETNQFHKASLICTSPNYWGDNNVGTKEYFFMLQGCKTDRPMRTFHIDQLNSELMAMVIRKALELLGNYKLVQPADKQLSGVGFNCTVRDELIVKVKGSHQRVLKIIF